MSNIFGKNLEHILIEALSGLAEYKDGTNEIWIQYGCAKQYATIEIENAETKKFTLRTYFKNGKKHFEAKYVNYQRQGEYKAWDREGKIFCVGRYSLGERNGLFEYPQSNLKVTYWRGRPWSYRHARYKVFKNGNFRRLKN